MATDATGTPTSPDSIPTYNTAADAPSGNGFNAAMAAIQTALSGRWLKSLFTTTGDIAYASSASTPARLGIGSTGNVLTVAAGLPAWAAPAATSTIYRKATSKTVNNTITETDLFNSEITLAANDLGTTKVARILAAGDWLQNSGGNTAAPRFKLKLGATTLIDTGALASPAAITSATRYPWYLSASIAELNATNAQWANFWLTLGSNAGGTGSTAFTTGEGYFPAVASGGVTYMFGGNVGAVDGTASQALVLSVILPTANASCEIVLKHGLVVIE